MDRECDNRTVVSLCAVHWEWGGQQTQWRRRLERSRTAGSDAAAIGRTRGRHQVRKNKSDVVVLTRRITMPYRPKLRTLLETFDRNFRMKQWPKTVLKPFDD